MFMRVFANHRKRALHQNRAFMSVLCLLAWFVTTWRVSLGAIAKCLKVSYRRSRTLAHEHGFGKPRKELSAAQLQALVADITNRRASAMALVKKHKCSYKIALSLAHQLLACERFLPSWRTRLSSYLPSLPDQPPKKQVAQ
jgi:hypothetical protein